jgi:RNA polymerase sigma-70 factor (ECF subfamily)
MEAQLAELPMTDAPPDADLALAPAAARPDADTTAALDLARARAGDEQGFRALVRLHQARVFSIALRFTGRRAEAEEAAQDVFVQLHGALAQIESAAHLKHWLLRAISHRCIDRQRREKRRPRLVSIDTMHELADGAAADATGDPLAGARLRRMLLELAPDARAVLLLRFQEDLDPTEIAGALGMSVNTVKSHMRRSLERLRARYSGEEHGY